MIKVTINGKEVLTDVSNNGKVTSYEESRKAVFAVLTTQNLLAEGVLKTLAALPGGPSAFLEVVNKSGNMTDVIEVSEKPQGQNEWKFKARAVREVFANCLNLAINRDMYKREIATAESTAKTYTGEIEKALPAEF